MVILLLIFDELLSKVSAPFYSPINSKKMLFFKFKNIIGCDVRFSTLFLLVSALAE